MDFACGNVQGPRARGGNKGPGSYLLPPSSLDWDEAAVPRPPGPSCVKEKRVNADSSHNKHTKQTSLVFLCAKKASTSSEVANTSSYMGSANSQTTVTPLGHSILPTRCLVPIGSHLTPSVPPSHNTPGRTQMLTPCNS
ncbi:unnamed protein product [Phytomonas sp. Hart1]|nr:unnamed protein product [Phytomonas sp. Hart1]|eukprot:CCW68748.1 unnamed protein product [Phytomonas sp. isolate Hart1]